MKATLKEIRRLQEEVNDSINALKDDPDADFDRLASLRTLSFNISMLFLRHTLEKDSTEVELEAADGAIGEALLSMRQEVVASSPTPQDFVGHLYGLCKGVSDDIAFIRSTLSGCDSPLLRENIAKKLDQAGKAMADLMNLREDAQMLTIWKNVQIVERGAAAAVLGRARSAKKAAAARENGKKGGRPRKKPPVTQQEG